MRGYYGTLVPNTELRFYLPLGYIKNIILLASTTTSQTLNPKPYTLNPKRHLGGARSSRQAPSAAGLGFYGVCGLQGLGFRGFKGLGGFRLSRERFRELRV